MEKEFIRLRLIRHGQTPGNRAHRYVGRTDEGILPEERTRLRAMAADTAEQPSLLFCSPARRCRETAECLFDTAASETVIVPEFMEMDFGAFEYMTWQEIDRDPDPAHRLAYQHYIDSGGESAFPGGEAKANFTARVCRGFEEKVLPRLRALQHGAPPGEVVILAHGGTLMALMEQYALPHRSYFDWHIAPGESIRTKLVFSSAGAVELRWSENPTQNICYE